MVTAAERETILSAWIKPSSADEKAQQQRAERMVRSAIAASPALAAAKPLIYTKGSYPNNTNVRRDSDVDVVVQLDECFYYESTVTPDPRLPEIPPYSGSWTPHLWRAEVLAALQIAFDKSNERHVTPGKVAINIDAVPDSRPSIDVVPSFTYKRYDSADRSIEHCGSTVFTTSLQQIVNWPGQQLRNGQAKNRATPRYKAYVRALKNAENALVHDGNFKALPSYFMECMIWNVPNSTLRAGSLATGFGETLGWMYEALNDEADAMEWSEPNDLVYLFRGQTKWSVNDARRLIVSTWDYLNYRG